MKLTKQQVDALAFKIYNEIKQEVKEHNDALQTEKEFLEWKLKNPRYKQLIEKVVAACNDIIEYRIEGYTADYNLRNIASWKTKDIDSEVEDIFKASLNLKNYPTETMLKNDIILSTIECDNLDDIIETIKKKYA